MATIPTPPTFTTNDSSLSNLSALSQAVTFLIRMDDNGNLNRPNWTFYKTATASLASGLNNLTMGTVAVDSDSVSDGTGATINTQGYYAVEGCADVESTTTEILFELLFLFTAGSSNPHYTSGTNVYFGSRGGGTITAGSQDDARCASDIVPVCCYPGDKLKLVADVSAAVTLNNNANNSYIQGRFTCLFSGVWLSTGT